MCKPNMLRRISTKQSIDYILDKHIDEISSYHKKIMKKSKRGVWTKRYLCIKDGYLLWNDKKVTINDNIKLDNTEKKKWKGSISLLMIKDNNGIVRVMKNKKGKWVNNRFNINIYDPIKKKDKTYKFKVYNKDEVMWWLDGFQKHRKALLGE